MKINLLFIIVLLFLPYHSFSSHIIGGEMNYRCSGSGVFEVELTLYRDCRSTGADFDTTIEFAIYRCGEEINCASLGQGETVETLILTNFVESSITVSSTQGCNSDIGQLLCFEKGVYNSVENSFSINLPASSDSYYIAYQRCCRSELKNIVNPAEQGSTYFVEITPEAQAGCNNSPIFNDIPPFVTCANEEIELDGSATDQDGDSLVYYFSEPISGGGPDLSPLRFQLCNGAFPSPSCPPPFSPVSYKPGFSNDNPIDIDNTAGGFFRINAHTGMITGSPSTQGNYLVGVSIDEYREGVFLGTTRRDFRLSVVASNTTVSVEEEFIQSTIFDISPNPANEQLTIHVELPKQKETRMTLLNLQGKVMYESTWTNNENFNQSIDLQTVPVGTYFLVLNVEGRLVSKRVVVLPN